MPSKTLDQLRGSVPPASDPRWRQLALHLAFLAYALTTPSFHRTVAQYALGLAGAVAAELLFQYGREKRVYFPISAVITSMGFQLLVVTPHPWVYAALGAAAMAGKNLARWRGRHVFNPSNAVVVACGLFVPAGVVLVTGSWGGSAWGLALAAGLGFFVVRAAGRLPVVVGYLAGFVFAAAALHLALDRPMSRCLAPLADPLFAVFAFFMITDPRTTPGGTFEGLVFGVLIAELEGFLRAGGAAYAPFYALCLMTLAEAAFPRAFGLPARAPEPAPAR
ncbi:MAG: hypothetical protein HY079_11235 [Elusimicrobia bacterium]|nr:hypothetical protein [Elusimicrobiota bacterium]